jgi:uncharacterized protein YbjT (DUF2867 family)
MAQSSKHPAGEHHHHAAAHHHHQAADHHERGEHKEAKEHAARLSTIASLPTTIPRPPTFILTNDDGRRGFIEVAPKGQARNLLSSCRRGDLVLVADASLVAPMDRAFSRFARAAMRG